MQKKQALAQSQQAAEQDQKLKIKLARRVLGASFQRLYPRHAIALDQPAEPGAEAGGGASSPAVPSASAATLERSDSHSRIPKLPPLADAAESPANLSSVDAGATARASGRASGDEPGLRQSQSGGNSPSRTLSGANGTTGGGGPHGHPSRHPHGRGSEGSRRSQHPLSRSASAGWPGAGGQRTKQSSSSSDGGGGDGGPCGRQPKQRQPQWHASTQPHSLQHHQQHPYPQHDVSALSRRRRTMPPEPPMQPVQEVREYGDDESRSSASASDDNSQDDVGVRDGRTVRHGKSAPGGAADGRPTARRHHALSAGPSATAARPFSRRVALAGLPPTQSGYAAWRARVQLREGQRTFCISGTGNHSQGIRAGLLARGWYENPDRNSPFFDFKWSANPLDINHETLWPGQMVNHFRHSTCLTTKHGLCHTVRDMVWYEAADWAAFYPRAYDIFDEASRREFLQDVRWTAAESLIKRALFDGAVCSTYVPYTPGKKPSTGTSTGSTSPSQQHQPSSPPGCSQPPPPQQIQQGVSPAPGSDADAGAIVGDGGSVWGSGGQAPASCDDGEGEAEGGAPVSTAAEGPGQRLRQPTDSSPLVDLPSLRLACRVVASRLRQQRHLRVAHESGGGSGGARREPGPPPPDVELTAAEWQQLVRHRALSCSAPVLPPPQFNPSWITHRTFITSSRLPPAVAPPRGNGSDGSSARSARRQRGRKSALRSSRSCQPGRRRRHRDGGGGGGGGGGAATDGEAVTGGSASDDDGSHESDGDRAAEYGTVSDGEGERTPARNIGGSAAAAAAVPRRSSPVAVVDAAELLREAYGKAWRRHSAPALQRQAAAAAGSDEELEPVGPCASSLSASAPVWSPSASTVGPDAVDAATSWLPQDLPPICYDDEALQTLDHATWRGAAEAILAALESSAVQTHVSGTNNVWIVKPAGKSRGRGIRLFNDPDALLSYIRGEEAQGLESRWIAQKYVERPLIIARRKFDIRQWVLVTDWNPLQAWFYSTCYLRFAADDYDPNNLDIFQHLTNNSVSKYYEGPKKEDEITAAGNMWSIPRFQTWLSEVYGRDDIWQALLQPAMRHIAICTLKSAQDLITPRKGSCQLYGYDFLIDDQLRVWLLEINSSPTLEPSTAITAELCADVQEDILKVVIDLPQKQAAATAAASTATAATPRRTGAFVDATDDGDPAAAAVPDTGKWELMIDGGEEQRQPQYTGLSLEVKGTAIFLPPPRSNPVGRLHAANRSQQQHQPQQHPHRPYNSQPQPPSHGPQHLPREDSSGDGVEGGGDGDGDGECDGSRSSGGGGGGSSLGQRVPLSVVGSASNPVTGVFGLSPVSRGPLSPRPVTQYPQPSGGGQAGHSPQPLRYGSGGSGGGGSGGGGGGEGAAGAAAPSPVGSAATAAMALRVCSTLSPPPSRGCHTPPGRSRTPRLSATPQMIASWDAAAAAAAVASTAGVSATSNGMPWTPDLSTLGAAGGGPGLSPSPKAAASRGELPSAVSLVFNPALPSQSPRDPLGPLTVRMSLLSRPGHGGPPGLGSTGVQAR